MRKKIRQGAMLLLLLLVVAPHEASARWLRAESDHFIVYGENSDDGLREMVSQLEDFHVLLTALTGARGQDSPNKLTIYMPSGMADMRTMFPDIPPTIGGFYVATPTATIAVVNQRIGGQARGQMDQALSILLHEYAHHFMYQYFPVAYPRWYSEGFAEYVGETRFVGTDIEIGRVPHERGGTLMQTRWVPLERLLHRPDDLRPGETLNLYAQGWLVTHYMFADARRRDALNAYLRAFTRGEDTQAALEAGLGISTRELESQLRRYVRGDIGFIRIVRASAARAPRIAITQMPPEVERLLLMDAAVQIGVSSGEAAAYVRRIRAAAANLRTQPFARRVLARAEAIYGDGAAAEQLLTSLIAETPNDGELLYLMGLRHLRENVPASRERAQEWFARAHRASPNHYPTLFAYARSLADSEERYSENTANILLLAHELAPQVALIGVHAAHLLMHREEFDQAAAILGPIANNLHTPLRERAKTLLEQARARQKPEGPPVPQQEREGSRRRGG